MRKVAIGISAAALAAAVAPANAQGVWIGVPGFGIGIGAAPAYAYGGLYYDDYLGGYQSTYAYEGYAFEPGYADDSYAYVPDGGYTTYSYEPGVTYGYATDGYRPRAGYTRTYAYSSDARTTRNYSHRATRGVVRSDRGPRAAVHSTEVRDRARMRNVSAVSTEREGATSRRSAVGTERESATSRRVRSEEASRAMAREPQRSRNPEDGKAGTSRVRTQY